MYIYVNIYIQLPSAPPPPCLNPNPKPRPENMEHKKMLLDWFLCGYFGAQVEYTTWNIKLEV